jgi:hypothetical protein
MKSWLTWAWDKADLDRIAEMGKSDLVERARRRAGQEAVKYKGREAEYPDDMWLLIKMAAEIDRLDAANIAEIRALRDRIERLENDNKQLRGVLIGGEMERIRAALS